MVYACVMHILSPRSLGPRPARSGRVAIATTLVAACAAIAACGASSTDHPATAAAPKAAAKPVGAVDMVVVPQLVGHRQDEAHRIVARAGLQLRWTGFTGKYGNGRYNIGCVKVLRQSPVAGEKRPRGASIAVIEAACRVPHQHPHGVTSGGQPEA
jgi:hypothetical protein